MLIRWGALLVLAVVLTGCAGQAGARPTPTQDPATPSETPSRDPEASTEPRAERLEIRAGSVRLLASVRDTAAARDLRAQLPVRLTMRDHGGGGKTGPPPRARPPAAAAPGADPPAG